MQNSIRKGDYELAGHCVWELLPKYENYLRKRFLVISAEDCFGILTKEIANLCKQPGDVNVQRALSLLCRAKKNRDADYFVCNLMRGSAPAEIRKEQFADNLVEAIRTRDVEKAGWHSNVLFKKNRKFLWQTLEEMADDYKPFLSCEFRALHEANETVTKPTTETIFAAKAIVLMMSQKASREGYLACPEIPFDGMLNPDSVDVTKPVENCFRVDGYFPEWAYNWHTYHGKYKLKRDAVHAISNDQKLLTPLEVNLFDDCTWNEDINACLQKWNPRRIRIPYDDRKRRPEEKFPGSDELFVLKPQAEQLTIFD